MLKDILLFLVIFLALAAALHQDFIFSILYLLGSSVILGHIWVKKASQSIQIERSYESHIFLGEIIDIKITIRNKGRLPLIWLSVSETTPVHLRITQGPEKVLSLPGKTGIDLSYKLAARKRGYFEIGPLKLTSGDLLGISSVRVNEESPARLIVYPKIIPLAHFWLSSNLQMGTLRDYHPIFEDPTRTIGKRDYVAGDSLRRIDWKTSASAGRLLVKKYEPSIELQTALFLNLNNEDYPIRSRHHDRELAITTAASIANWAQGRKQVYGLWVNGADPIDLSHRTQPKKIKKGHEHLINLLELLARVEPIENSPFLPFLRQESATLSWGTTLIIITPCASPALFDEIHQIKRAGHQCLLLICGLHGNYNEVKHLCAYGRIPVKQIRDEHDLEKMG